MTRNKENNIVICSVAELTKLGYKQPVESKDKKGNFSFVEPGSFLCLTKTENAGELLWAELDSADIKSAKLTTEKGKFLILTKNE